MKYSIPLFFVFFFLFRKVLSNEPIISIFTRQFGWHPDDSIRKCNNDEAETISRTKTELIDANKNVDEIIKEKITNQTTWVELSDLTGQHCDRNETIKFLSQKLVDAVQECLKNSLDDAKRSEIVREFVSNSCASIYNKYNIQ